MYVKGRTLPEAWELSIYELWRVGNKVWCEYNEWTIDAPALIVVEEPLAEPRVHLKGCVAGLRGLKEYVKEVLEGVNDWRIGRDWHYTYHERIFSYLPPVFRNDEEEVRRLDQIEYVVRKLRKAPESRRAIVVIWQPWKDEMTDYPPCLVYLWFRVMDDLLELHVHMRSNDALKAAFMNMYAYIELQRLVADRLGYGVGRYVHFADSYHIYERDWKWAEKFVEQIERQETPRYWLPSSKLG